MTLEQVDDDTLTQDLTTEPIMTLQFVKRTVLKLFLRSKICSVKMMNGFSFSKLLQ